MIGLLELEVPRRIRSTPPAQWVLRGVVLAAAALGAVAVDAAAGGMPWIWGLVLLATTAWTLAAPDSAAAGGVLVVLGSGWWLGVERGDHTSGWLLVLVVAMVLVHVGAALASAGPPTASFDLRTGRRWLTATGVVVALATLAWALVVGFETMSTPASTVRLVAALGAVAWLAWYVRSASLDDPDVSWYRRDDRE